MKYMAVHGSKRARPAELVPGTVSVITARMDYLPAATPQGWQRIELDRLQYLRKQIEVGATMNDLEKSGVLSFDVRVAGKLIFDV